MKKIILYILLIPILGFNQENFTNKLQGVTLLDQKGSIREYSKKNIEFKGFDEEWESDEERWKYYPQILSAWGVASDKYKNERFVNSINISFSLISLVIKSLTC